MARDLDLTGQINLKGGDKAVSQLEDIADAAEQLEDPVDIKFRGDTAKVKADIDDVLSKVDQLAGTDAAKLVLTSNAAAVTNEIADLVMEINTLDASDPEITIKSTNIRDLEDGLGRISDKAKDVVEKTGGMGSAMGSAFGEASEDLAGLVGITGTAQQAIGNLAGDLTTAATSAGGLSANLAGLGAGAGLVAVSLAIGQIQKELAAAAATDAFNAARVASFTDALDDASVSAKELSDSLGDKQKGEGIMVRIADETTRVDEAIQKTFGTFKDFQTQVDQGTKGFDSWSESQLNAAKATGANKIQLYELKSALDDARDGTIDGGSKAYALAAGYYDVVQAATALGAATTGIAEAQDEAAFKAQFYGDTLAEVDETQAKARQTAIDYAAVLASSDWQTSTVDSAAAAFQRLGQEHFAAANVAAQAEAAYDSLGAAILQNGTNFDVATEAGRANSDQIQQLYSSLIPNLAKAFDDSNGSLSSFQTNMNKLSTETFTKLQTEAGLTAEQAGAVIEQLGAFDGTTYSSTFEMLGMEDANYKLGLLQGVLGSLDPVIQQQVALDIIEGDPVAALARVQAAITGGPQPEARVAIAPGEDTATPAIQGVVSTPWGTTVNIDGEPSKANAAVESVDTKAQETKPMIDIGANTAAAIVTMMLINGIAKAMAPVINIGANTFPALGAASAAVQVINGMHARVPVDAYIRNTPSASSIASNIGVVRVPVDTYIRNEVRVNGGRP